MFRHLSSSLRILSPTERLFQPRQLAVLFVLMGLGMVVSAATASAQSGSFLESLFRSIAEKKIQESAKRRIPPAPQPLPDELRSPQTGPSRSPPSTGGFPAGPLGPARVPPPTRTPRSQPQASDPQNRQHRSQPNVRVEHQHQEHIPHENHSGAMQRFANDARQFQQDLSELLRTVQKLAQTSRDREQSNELRVLFPELYRIQAETEALASRSRNARSIDEFRDDYRSIDQRYREVSFRLRSLPGRDASLRSQVAKCDRLCHSLAKSCSIAPQFDRHGLHDQMVIAATYMQALIDDLPSARMPVEQSRELIHQARLLRQAILEKADAVETIEYEAIVSDFTQFVARWQEYANNVAKVRDPILDRRLARVSECGDETYALLWMPPPSRSSGLVVDRPRDHPRNGRDDILIGDPRSRYREQLMANAASLEGAAQYLQADLNQLQRYLKPDSYSRDLLASLDEVYRLARSIHSQLEAGQPASRLQRSASDLASAWESFSGELQHIDHHGLSSRRAATIMRQQQEMLPLVASLTASLLPVN